MAVSFPVTLQCQVAVFIPVWQARSMVLVGLTSWLTSYTPYGSAVDLAHLVKVAYCWGTYIFFFHLSIKACIAPSDCKCPSSKKWWLILIFNSLVAYRQTLGTQFDFNSNQNNWTEPYFDWNHTQNYLFN